ncbi:MAG TPA: response regulator [Longilinea sp.]|jgi:two-component system, cell cycle response regulator DivK|nr:response regulator [Longilinea sp.]
MPLPSKIILNIEDNFENRMLIRRLLESMGYTVIEAENARQALDFLETGRPDLILMDINMPDVDGWSLARQLKQNPEIRPIPIIAITANALRGDREKTLNSGCDGYIEKPIDIDVFFDEMEKYLG